MTTIILCSALSRDMRCQTTVVVLLVFSFSSATALIVYVVLSRDLNWRVLCEQEKKQRTLNSKQGIIELQMVQWRGNKKTMYIRVARCSWFNVEKWRYSPKIRDFEKRTLQSIFFILKIISFVTWRCRPRVQLVWTPYVISIVIEQTYIFTQHE